MAGEHNYDAVLILSFGGPEKPEDVIPFLENVLRGRNVPRERMLEVAGHYYHFGGKSPINDQNRALIAGLEDELERKGPRLPVYWGNRNWHPFLTETLHQMRSDGVQRALAFVTSAFSSYSGCRQYLEDIQRARAEAGEGAPEIDKLRSFYNHPSFIEAEVDRVRAALDQIDADQRAKARVIYTAHSVPLAIAATSDYQRQLNESCRLVSERLALGDWQLVYQSRSGAPGLHMVRAPTVGVHPKFLSMIRELILERLGPCQPRAVGRYGPNQDVCAPGCCSRL
jgi:ferrochelatase